eukprot:Gregarina_sp_Poly_1__5084@NODE_2695_length_1814_cov_130_357756_g1710_i0_p1_GENE_NODE_2695_length_1814_cov_130_357756_g1710_i0NODE_2695_length_1814_cov_130_357756_g1710_i0_p1_ORF_typecomplete_len553_score76_47FAD_binding_3/PF01494_19/1_6e55Lycopene_cycl/PF05834_12/2_5e07Pyr_redox_2/PF07992_14/6_4e06Trp_halogenase/PF04820_14/2_7e05Thi4/PF01946_17/6_1e05Thi4/PF01946_17/1e04SE/PF08491_10/8_4e05Pyr_redox_3/PF13738_6/0_00025Pyr_redox_3/PF13738_6/1_6e03HI0933_like/PF03486_14/0_0032HI0933_like/PF03486_1
MKAGSPLSSVTQSDEDEAAPSAEDKDRFARHDYIGDMSAPPRSGSVRSSPYSPFAALSDAATSSPLGEEELMVDPNLPNFTDVLILGAGPAGLLLSHELAKLGVDHLVIDHGRIDYPSDPTPELQGTLPTQGILLQPSSLDLLQEVGIMETLTLHGRPLQGASIILDNEVVESLERFPKSVETRFQSAIVLEQWRLERLLCDRLQIMHSKVFRHHVAYKLVIRVSSNSVAGTDSVSDASSIELDPSIRAAYKVKVFIRRMDPVNRRPIAASNGRWIRAKYVVGADGVRSMTRRALEIETESLGSPHEYLVADIVVVHWGHPLLQSCQGGASRGNSSSPSDNHLIVIHCQSGSGLLFPYNSPGHWRMMLRRGLTEESSQNKAKDSSFIKLQIPSVQDIKDIVHQLVPNTIVDQVGWRTSYTVEPKVAATFYKERGIIIGDAARQESPLWSAGVNSAIHDAVSLGWRLAAVVNGGADESLLETFSDERRQISINQIRYSETRRDSLLNYAYVQRCVGAAQIRKIIPLLNSGSPEIQEALAAVAIFPPQITRYLS